MRYTFPKTERLTSKKLIDRLFDRSAQAGLDAVQSVYAYPFRVLFLRGENQGKAVPPLQGVAQLDGANLPQVLFSVPKRAFKHAVDRNAIRRRCREAYRLNKHRLLDKQGALPAAITFLYTAKTKISFEEIDKGMKLAMKRL